MPRRLAALALAVALPMLPLPGRSDVVVRPGETLSEIAERHGVSLSRLMQANGISNPEFVEAGRRLVLPGQVSRASGGSAGRAGGGSVVVQPGDTLSEIAMRHGLSLQRLMQLNGISDPSHVEAGRRLVVAAGSATGGSGSGGASRRGNSGSGGTHTVQSGETLSEIAARYGTSTSRLMELNGIGNADLVVSGTRLALPVRPGAAQAQTASRERPAYDRTAKVHVVRPGESLSQIAAGYRIPIDRLVALNSLSDPDLLTSGTRLTLVGTPPAARPAPAKAATTKPTPTNAAPAKPTAAKAATARPAQASPAQPTTAAKPSQAATGAAPAAATPASRPAAASRTSPTPSSSPTTSSSTPTASAPTASSAAATATARPTATTASAAATTARGSARGGAVAAATTGSTTAKATASGAAKTATAKATPQPSKPDWRSYGPLQVDWANWQSMGGSYVAPSLSGDGQPLYTAINCSARKLNSTSQNGQWNAWEAPRNDSEQQLVNDLCKAKGG